MPKATTPNPWARKLFGTDMADALARVLPEALQAAEGRRADAQDGSGCKDLFAYGSVWQAPFEEFERALKENLPSHEVIRHPNRLVDVVIVDGVLLLPFKYAKDHRTRLNDKKPQAELWAKTKILFEAQPEAIPDSQPPLEGLEATMLAEMSEVSTSSSNGKLFDKIVIIFYASNYHSGLLNVGWGELAMVEGEPVVTHRSQLAVPTSIPIPGISFKHLSSDTSSATSTVRFDESAPLEDPVLKPRRNSTNSEPVETEFPEETEKENEQE